MTNPSNQTAAPTQLSGWDEIRRLADELRLEIHLGTMEARERWEALQPQLQSLERKVTASGARAGSAISSEIEALREALRELRARLGRVH